MKRSAEKSRTSLIYLSLYGFIPPSTCFTFSSLTSPTYGLSPFYGSLAYICFREKTLPLGTEQAWCAWNSHSRAHQQDRPSGTVHLQPPYCACWLPWMSWSIGRAPWSQPGAGGSSNLGAGNSKPWGISTSGCERSWMSWWAYGCLKERWCVPW